MKKVHWFEGRADTVFIPENEDGTFGNPRVFRNNATEAFRVLTELAAQGFSPVALDKLESVGPKVFKVGKN